MSIEFQSAHTIPARHLNVGACMLGSGQPHLTFSIFERAPDDKGVIDTAPETADRAVVLALEKAGELERQLSKLRDAQDRFLSQASVERLGWTPRNAAISAAICQDWKTSELLLRQIIDKRSREGGQKAIRAVAELYLASSGVLDNVTSVTAELVHASRHQLGLADLKPEDLAFDQVC